MPQRGSSGLSTVLRSTRGTATKSCRLGRCRSRTCTGFYEQPGWHGQQVEQTVFLPGGASTSFCGEGATSSSRTAESMTLAPAVSEASHSPTTFAPEPRLTQSSLPHATREARSTRTPGETFYGDARDASRIGHVWEIACNPGFPLDQDAGVGQFVIWSAQNRRPTSWAYATIHDGDRRNLVARACVGMRADGAPTSPTLTCRTAAAGMSLSIGTQSAPQLLVTDADNPERLLSESSFANLVRRRAATCQLGKTQRHRLNAEARRDPNCALHTIAVNRLSHCPRIRAYLKKRARRQGRPRHPASPRALHRPRGL